MKWLRFSCFILSFLFSLTADANPKTSRRLTIIHTNDIHSHFKPSPDAKNLGGVARIATTINRIRESTENSILLDGGDWSEGHIYYKLGAGRASIQMLNELGYDAVALGNHDWLNGPDVLLNLFKETPPKFKLLSSNIDFSKYEKADELSSYFNYDSKGKTLAEKYGAVILNVGGSQTEPPIRVGVIGVTTFELIYDHFFSPVSITDPLTITRKIAKELRSKTDLIVVLSHNSEACSWLIAGFDVDVVIGSHDHKKYLRPLKNKALLVEAGQWGEFVGRLDLVINTDTKKVGLEKYTLIQQDASVPDSESIQELVKSFDVELERNDLDKNSTVVKAQIDIRRETEEPLLGNIIADAIKAETKVDLALEHVGLTSGQLYKGDVHLFDVFNAISPIFTLFKQGRPNNKAWTIHTYKMNGETLTWFFNGLVSYSTPFSVKGLPNVSGAQVIYDSPQMLSKLEGIKEMFGTRKALKSLKIGNAIVERDGIIEQPDREFLVASSESILELMRFMEEDLGNEIKKTNLIDTGKETWRVVADYLKKLSPISSEKIQRGGRLQTLQSDLAIYADEIKVDQAGCLVTFELKVRNMGLATSEPRQLFLGYDATPWDFTDDPNERFVEKRVYVQPVRGEGSVVIKNAFLIPPQHCYLMVDAEGKVKSGLTYYLKLDSSDNDPNLENNSTVIIN